MEPMQAVAVVTVIGREGLPDNLLGQKLIFPFEGEGGTGNIELPWLADRVAELVKSRLPKGVFEVASFSNPVKPEQSATVMIDLYLPPPELVILGGGHIALPLVTIGRLLGYQVAVVDDRPDFASAKRFPEAERVICCDFANLEDVLTLGPQSSVLIVTRGHKHDLDCLRQAIKYPLAYLGMIGSRRRIHMVRRQLLEEGFDIERIDKVHMPVGLDIGAQTPEEVAVSIGAELIKVRRGGSAHSLKDGRSQTVPRLNVGEMTSAANKEILQQAIKAAQDNTPAALATIVKTGGSTPRKAGARMLVYRHGRTLGTIGGGCSESGIRLEAFNVIDQASPCLHKVSLNADIAAMEGMVCGGTMEVFVEPVSTFAEIFKDGEVL